MATLISVVINTLNEEKNIKEAIQTVNWADEIIICDMYSEDKTVEIAKKMGAKVYFHKRENYVEPARNFAVSKVSNPWVLIIDADERVSETLGKRLQEIAEKMGQIDFIRIPRKNIIFNKWMQASMWWPDLNIRFFKKGKVVWGNQIHRPPQTFGQGLDLPLEEEYALTHYNYKSITDYLQRMERYTAVQANELNSSGYKFTWKDLLEKPLGEFLSRYFANYGYKDGLHGLALSLMQSFSFMMVYLKLWEMDKFKEQDITLIETEKQKDQAGKEINYWFNHSKSAGNIFKKVFRKILN